MALDIIVAVGFLGCLIKPCLEIIKGASVAFNSFITSADSLVTSHEETRAGFLKIALEKNRIGDPYIRNALAFKSTVAHTTKVEDLLAIDEVKPFLVAASGLSDKALTHLTEDDKNLAIQELIDKFLKPAGDHYIDEVTFRYLLNRGDALGGTMRNRIGAIGQERLVRTLLSNMSVQGIGCDMLHTGKKWEFNIDENAAGIEANVKAIHWRNRRGDALLVLNATVPVVKKNVDICLFNGAVDDYDNGGIVKNNHRAIMFGELKSGIDPAGADEHWKTGNSALNRIRTAFKNIKPGIQTSFVGAAIEKSMAEEIYSQLKDGTLTNAANLTKDDQLNEYCSWLLTR